MSGAIFRVRTFFDVTRSNTLVLWRFSINNVFRFRPRRRLAQIVADRVAVLSLGAILYRSGPSAIVTRGLVQIYGSLMHSSYRKMSSTKWQFLRDCSINGARFFRHLAVNCHPDKDCFRSDANEPAR